MKIIIADDHILFAEGLKNLLESRNYHVTGIAKNGIEAYKMAEKYSPDVMLIDILMPECDGLEATMLINSRFPKIQIVILTSSENENDIFDAVKAGACCYFIKNFESKQLFSVLESLKQSEIPVSPGMAGRILNELHNDSNKTKNHMKLTKRQKEVLSLVAKGYVYREIADNLCISERTVKYHVQSAIDKLHLQNRNQLINYTSQTGMIDQ